jgi:hypothetical protein
MPPEFTDLLSMTGFADLYSRDIDVLCKNPVNEPWFARLRAEATADDLTAIETALEPKCGNAFHLAYTRFLQGRLLNGAHAADKRGEQVSPAIPAWFRAAGWIPSTAVKWSCE